MAIKTCRICGNTYEGCRSVNTSNVFRWQDVACSKVCGAEYLRLIKISRGEADAEDPEINETVAEAPVEIEDDFDEDFVDDEDEDYADDNEEDFYGDDEI